MSELTRRGFLKKAAAGSAAVAAAGAAYGGVGKLLRLGSTPPATSPTAPFAFRASTGLPQRPYPSYASLMLEGSVDPVSGTGMLKRSVAAGAPEAHSGIVLPGTERTYRIGAVRRDGRSLLVRGDLVSTGVGEKGEPSSILVRIDQAKGTVGLPFGSRQMELALAG